MKSSFIFHHLWNVFGSWESCQQGLFCPINFAKAFDLVTHDYFSAFFVFMGRSDQYVNILLYLFRAPIAPIVHEGVQLHHIIRPGSGVRQGCPLSPTLFAMLISPLVSKLNELSECVSILLYVDDLLIIVRAPPALAASLMLLARSALDTFTSFSGLSINIAKSALLLKGHWEAAALVALSRTGLPVSKSYKYLGVILGDVPSEQAFAPALRKAMGRAASMHSWNLSLRERAMLLELWILPVIGYPAKVVFPTPQVVSTLKSIYNVALGLNSWGLTHKILSLPETEGGVSLATPESFLRWQHATPFVRSVVHPTSFPQPILSDFRAFSARHGILITAEFLPFFQMGSNVIWKSMPYLAWSARSFSLARQHIPFSLDEPLPYDLPLWHNAIFRNQQNLTYFSPALIRGGVLTVGQLMEDDSTRQLLPPQWGPIYEANIRSTALPPQHPPLPQPSFWLNWTVKKVALFLSYPHDLPPRQPKEIRSAFNRITLPPSNKDFVRLALWALEPQCWFHKRCKSRIPPPAQCAGLQPTSHL